MKVLFIGGTGIISTACTKHALEQGIELFHLNRGRSDSSIPGVKSLTADINDIETTKKVLAGHQWDAVVQWIAFHPNDIERDLQLFQGCAKQYFFISSASVYQKTEYPFLTTEETPQVNPFWDYSQNKIACEERLRRAQAEEGFPFVIIRPSYTYGDTLVPFAVNAWPESWTFVDRLRSGKQCIIPGNGFSLWTMTHNTDFAVGLNGLLGREAAIGEAFHITSDECLCWNDYAHLIAKAAGVEKPNFVHIATDFIIECDPGEKGHHFGDKSASRAFDNSKIKRLVPEFQPKVRFAEGIKRTIDAFDANPARKVINAEMNIKWDRILAAYQKGLEAARAEFHH
ncbi:NAD-dependent epimerase/dehydratase family protein [Pelagicoccus albus]|uniref:NAD-dependent epimerase/dehydratase family protein n=1 Tax=Pelagicoccus albus TaxID=415222 RepID=A0A7X1E8R8_9BACT|nr:NAD-dependent epimerase/dehydratase family protein [Pelagicoccus albus]MBC2607055.1 NAD-dependent epimerase/dehydratase family protein [Pelagicoccus albus]